MKTWIAACAAILVLSAAPAWAGDCETEIAEVEAAIQDAFDVDPSHLRLAEELLKRAIQECVDDDPLAETGTPGLAMLAAAKDLLEID